MVDLATLLYKLTAGDAGCYSARRNLPTHRSNTALSGPDHAKTIYQKIHTLNQIPVKDYAPPRQLTHNFSNQRTSIIRPSRFLSPLTRVTPNRIASSFHLFLHVALSPTHCQHLYDNRKSRSVRSSKQHDTMPRDRGTRYLNCFCAEWRALLPPRVTNRAENRQRPTHLSHHWRSHTLALSQPFRQPHRRLPARNSAFRFTSSPALLIGGYVLLWEQPGSE